MKDIWRGTLSRLVGIVRGNGAAITVSWAVVAGWRATAVLPVSGHRPRPPPHWHHHHHCHSPPPLPPPLSTTATQKMSPPFSFRYQLHPVTTYRTTTIIIAMPSFLNRPDAPPVASPHTLHYYNNPLRWPSRPYLTFVVTDVSITFCSRIYWHKKNWSSYRSFFLSASPYLCVAVFVVVVTI